MAWLYERPYAVARGNETSYRQWEDERPVLQGSGRRAIHWRHLDSHIKFSHDHSADDYSPSRDLAERRRQQAKAEAINVAERTIFLSDDSVKAPQRKRYVEPKAQAASVEPYGIIRENYNDRRARRNLHGPPDDLNPDFSPRSRTPTASSKRVIQTPVAGENTQRVLDTSAEYVAPWRGLKCNPPPDEIKFGMVGNKDFKTDRGLKCHYDVPQTLSFKL